MSQYREILKYTWAIAISFATILWISLLFPQSGRFQYEFQKGFVWSYPDLYAPFDFPLIKSPEEISKEKEEIITEQNPYYKVDGNIEDNVLERSNLDIESWIKDQIPEDSSYLIEWELVRETERFIRNLYDQPIGNLRPEDEGKQAINLIRNDNSLKTIPITNILSIEKAKDQINNWSPVFPNNLAIGVKEILSKHLEPNVHFDKKETDLALDSKLAQISERRGVIKKGELIIPKGALVSDDHFQVITSLKDQYASLDRNSSSRSWVFGGFLLLTLLIIGVYILYLWNHHRSLLTQPRQLSFLFMWFVSFSYLVYAIETHINLSSYLIPFCIVPIVVKNYFNERLAFFTHIVVILIASFLSNLGYEFTFLQILAGIITVLTVKETREWSAFFKTILLIFTTYILGYTGLEWIKNGGVDNFDVSSMTWLSINAFLILLAYPLIPLLERIFGFVSSITLVELNDINRPLLKELSIKAPGTFHHSLQVGNIAEDAAISIGANGLLLKTAALYHDIGKMNNPEYFIENQRDKNPHQESDWKTSATIIIRHVTDGAAMAKKAGLPQKIISFILTHHGTTRVEYFYRKYLEENPGILPDSISSEFTYPGPKPATKEEAILLLADSLEAACKSLTSPSAQDIDKLVDDIVSFKLSQGQFTKAELTFSELEQCKESFKKTLKSIHHVRIAYPKAPE